MGCKVCRARKVKCDGRLIDGCRNCARLDLACDLGGEGRGSPAAGGRGKSAPASPASPSAKTRRTYRSCAGCRAAKAKCNGDQPTCLRCRARSITCVYTATSGPLWTRVLLDQDGTASSSVSNSSSTGTSMQARGPPSPSVSTHTVASARNDDHLPPSHSAYLITPGSAADGVPSASRTALRGSSAPSLNFAIDTDASTDSAMHAEDTTHPLPLLNISEEDQGSQGEPLPGGKDAGDDSPSLAWLYSAQLPDDPERLRRVVDHYFCNVHPLRCFAFVHKPSFMRQLDNSAACSDAEALATAGSDETALLQIICAHGAKFCALEYSETVRRQPAKMIQAAGHEWAKAAEQTLMTNYGRITVTSLMTAVLLYDYRYRLGDFAHALMMSGLTTRMAHALQLNMEYTPRRVAGGESSGEGSASTTVLSPVEKEARRRLMWACYIIDTWTGSGMDQLTLLHEQDLHIQLPCNERDFLFQRSVVTRQLNDATRPAGTDENAGMMSSYIRLVSIWKRVAKYVKHLDTAAMPWLADSEFAVLDDALRTWREGLAPYLDFSPDSIYTRLESSQLGALALLHCTYCNAMLDLYRIAMPELFSLRHAFSFPPERTDFLQNLQARSFHLACGMSSVLAKTAAQGSRHLSDSMTPMFAYNSSRVMLYYLVRLHDPSRPDTKTTVDETIQHVQSNNRVLQLASAMMPLSEPLLITARRWLEKLQSGLHKQDATSRAAGMNMNIMPTGPSDMAGLADAAAGGGPALSALHSRHSHLSRHGQDADNMDTADISGADSSTDTPDNVLHPLSLFRLARKTLNDKAYSEPSSRASYAGGGLPPLRDVASHSRTRSQSHSRHNLSGGPYYANSSMDQRASESDMGNTGYHAPVVIDTTGHISTANDAIDTSAPAPVAIAANVSSYPSALSTTHATPAPGVTAFTTNWESAFDDLATGLHVLQDYPHWDINGFDHISNNVFDGNGLATAWPEYRNKMS